MQTGSLDLSAPDVASRHSPLSSRPALGCAECAPAAGAARGPHASDRGATASPGVVAQGEAGSCHSEDGERAGLPAVAVEASVGGRGPAAAPLAGRSSGKPRWLAKSPDFSSGILKHLFQAGYFHTRQEVSEPTNLLFPQLYTEGRVHPGSPHGLCRPLRNLREPAGSLCLGARPRAGGNLGHPQAGNTFVVNSLSRPALGQSRFADAWAPHGYRGCPTWPALM